MEIKINVGLHTPEGFLPEGSTINLKVDKYNIPLQQFWRNRLKDSKHDNCIAVITEEKKKEIVIKANGKS